jgi:transcriptional regulator with XRE-family HTH domain
MKFVNSTKEVVEFLQNVKGITREQLAKEFGVNKGDLSKYVNNNRETRFGVISKWAATQGYKVALIPNNELNSDHELEANDSNSYIYGMLDAIREIADKGTGGFPSLVAQNCLQQAAITRKELETVKNKEIYPDWFIKEMEEAL